MRVLIFLSHLFLFSERCFAVSIIEPSQSGQPWLTGPLLTPAARVIGVGQANVEPYFFWNVTTGRYSDNWKVEALPSFNQIISQVNLKMGVYEKVDFSATLLNVYSFIGSRSGDSFGDFSAGVGYQIYKGGTEKSPVYFKLSIQEIFPTGRYQKLNPAKLKTDAGGFGSFITKIGLTYSTLAQISIDHFLSYRFHFASSLSAPVRLKGCSIYGGDRSTRGTLKRRSAFFFLGGFEYTLSKEFVFACDFEAQCMKRGSFRGFTNIPLRLSESFQCSLAPAIEYNWSSSMGIILGSWFTVAGRNASRFISFAGAFNYSF